RLGAAERRIARRARARLGRRRGGLVGRVLLGAALLVTCAAPVASTARPASGGGTFVIPTQLANGRVELTIQPHYVLGETVRIPVTIATARGTITGPIAARVLASGINERK